MPVNDKEERNRVDLRKLSDHSADLTLVKENKKGLRFQRPLVNPTGSSRAKVADWRNPTLDRNGQNLVLLLYSVMDWATQEKHVLFSEPEADAKTL